jgi:hypothetical protein
MERALNETADRAREGWRQVRYLSEDVAVEMEEGEIWSHGDSRGGRHCVPLRVQSRGRAQMRSSVVEDAEFRRVHSFGLVKSVQPGCCVCCSTPGLVPKKHHDGTVSTTNHWFRHMISYQPLARSLCISMGFTCVSLSSQDVHGHALHCAVVDRCMSCFGARCPPARDSYVRHSK